MNHTYPTIYRKIYFPDLCYLSKVNNSDIICLYLLLLPIFPSYSYTAVSPNFAHSHVLVHSLFHDSHFNFTLLSFYSAWKYSLSQGCLWSATESTHWTTFHQFHKRRAKTFLHAASKSMPKFRHHPKNNHSLSSNTLLNPT